MNANYITIGIIVRAAGIKGEVKVKPLTDDINRYTKLKVVYIDTRPYKIESVRFDKNFAFLKLNGIIDRNAAEELQNKSIEIDRINAVPLDDDRYFITDILNSKVYLDDGTYLGKLTDVAQNGAADVMTVTDGKQTVRFPFLKKLAVTVDTENSVIVLNAAVFSEVSVYED